MEIVWMFSSLLAETVEGCCHQALRQLLLSGSLCFSSSCRRPARPHKRVLVPAAGSKSVCLRAEVLLLPMFDAAGQAELTLGGVCVCVGGVAASAAFNP